VSLTITGDAAADALLSEDPFALIVGMLLDQQVTMEKAFLGPWVIAERLGDAGASLDPETIASLDPEAFVEIMRTPPAVHRYPGSMAERVQALAQTIVEEYHGDTSAIWADADSGKNLLHRVRDLPGFGEQKAQIFIALLGKQCGLDVPGWREASAPYGDDGTFRSVADIVDGASLARVREFKREAKQAAKRGTLTDAP
jgi:uncharacterized HhH-GPD family protein